MANDRDSHFEFYAPWPLLGKRFSAQLGEVRQNMEELHPVIRYSATYDKDEDGPKQSRLRGWEYGDTSKHNRFRTISDTDHQWKIQANTGTEAEPLWHTIFAVGEDLVVTNFYLPNDIHVTTTNGLPNIQSGTLIFDRNYFYLTPDSHGRPIVNFDAQGNLSVPIDVDDGVREYLSVGNISFSNTGFYLSTGSLGQPVVNAKAVGGGGSAITVDDGSLPEYANISRLSFSGDAFYLTGGSLGQPVVNFKANIGGGKVVQSFSASKQWTATHNLNQTPIIAQIYDNRYRAILPHEEDVSNPNIAYFYFLADTAGTAILSTGASGLNITTGGGGSSSVTFSDSVKTFVDDTIHFNRASFYLTPDSTGNPVLNFKGQSSVTFSDGVKLFNNDKLNFNRTSFYLEPSSTGVPVVNFKHDISKYNQRGATWVKGGTFALVASEAPLVQLYVPVEVTITGVEILTNGGSGSCVVDIWQNSYGNYPPTVADSITGNNKPTITSATKYKDTTLSGWKKKRIPADSTLTFKLNSTSTFTFVSCTLTLQQS